MVMNCMCWVSKRGIKGDSVCQVLSVVVFQPFAHLTIVCSFFFVLICRIFLYIVDIIPFSVTCSKYFLVAYSLSFNFVL